ncbi:MAG: hypothetical protein ACOYN4_08910 [Bacteroidales bacterium]
MNKQVWVDQLMENFYPDSSFLKHAKDFSSMVENDSINIAAAGLDPDVLINNTTYPIAIVQRVDTPIKIDLDKFETKNTLVRRPDAIEYAYNQLESVLMGHRNTLRAQTAIKAAHAFAPAGNTTDTPVIKTTGTLASGRRPLTIDDILSLKEKFDDANIPLEGRILVLNTKHLSDLIKLDITSFKDITDITNGLPKTFAGFGILQLSKTAYFNATTLVKLGYGATPAGTDSFCSFAFHSNEVMKADGEVYMYMRENDPELRGTIVGFDKRFIAVPIRNKGIGAIVSALS